MRDPHAVQPAPRAPTEKLRGRRTRTSLAVGRLGILLSLLAGTPPVDAQPTPSGTASPAAKPAASTTASGKKAPASPTSKPTPGTPGKPASSAKPRKPTAQEIQETNARVKHHFEAGQKAVADNDWPKAYEAFLAAWRTMQLPQIALNLGRAELMTGRFREAIPHLRFCIERSNPKNRDEGAEISLANDWLAEAQKKAAKVIVKVDLAGAHVEVDDQPEGTAPLSTPLLVNPGSHIVKVWLGDKRAQKGILTESGAVLTIDLVLDPKPPPPRGSFERWRFDRPLVRAGAAGMLAALTVGAVTGALALDKQFAADNCPYDFRPDWSQDCWHRLDAERTQLAIASTIGFGAAGAFAIAAIVAAGVDAPSSRSTKETSVLVVAPFVAPSEGGLAITGRF